jgi:hypothetical protein
MRQLAAFSMPPSSQMLLRKLRMGDRERHGYLSDSDVGSGSKADLANLLGLGPLYTPVQTSQAVGERSA